jgi:putative ATPase
MRPRNLTEYIGQTHLMAKGKPLGEALRRGQLHSMILWGPPGTGKTSIARLVARLCDARYDSLSAVLSGVKEIRSAIDLAKEHQQMTGQASLLFVDEVHRFNKSQQDAFLPHIEEGTIVFIGATTENPSFELNNALLSRARVYVLQSLSDEEIVQLMQQALLDTPRGLGQRAIHIDADNLHRLAAAADGDARKNHLDRFARPHTGANQSGPIAPHGRMHTPFVTACSARRSSSRLTAPPLDEPPIAIHFARRVAIAVGARFTHRRRR